LFEINKTDTKKEEGEDAKEMRGMKERPFLCQLLLKKVLQSDPFFW